MKLNNTSDALEIIYQELYAGKPERISELEEARLNDHVARQIRELRQKAGLTQRELAGIVGIKESVIVCLEEADFEGNSLSMLTRIASALKTKIKIEFVPI